jgi:hypothetical protein
MQYSKRGLTSDLYNLTITFLLLNFMFRFIIPNMPLAFLTAIAHCLDAFPDLSITTPKSLSCVIFLI